jgi:hypothetical protein
MRGGTPKIWGRLSLAASLNKTKFAFRPRSDEIEAEKFPIFAAVPGSTFTCSKLSFITPHFGASPIPSQPDKLLGT